MTAGNRRYASSWFRWNSPDPAGVKVVSLTDPQSWNMYMYSHDNPVTFNDPTGLCGATLTDPCPTPTQEELDGLRGLVEGGGEGATAAGVAAAAATGAVVGVAANVLIRSYAAKIKAQADYKMAVETAVNNAIIQASRRKKSGAGKRGGGGRPRYSFPTSKSRKIARERATRYGEGKPIHHAHPSKGQPHYHPTDQNGNKIPGPHFCYPKSQCLLYIGQPGAHCAEEA